MDELFGNELSDDQLRNAAVNLVLVLGRDLESGHKLRDNLRIGNADHQAPLRTVIIELARTLGARKILRQAESKDAK